MRVDGGMDLRDYDDEKRAAAQAAVAEVADGMTVGLGTGSTVAFAIAALARRCREGLSVRVVATSLRTEYAANAAGIEVMDFSTVSRVDLAIDGVDQIDPGLRAIKGAGGAMLREKIVAQAAVRMIAICDSSKYVPHLPRGPLPVEVMPFAQAFVTGRIKSLGAGVNLRMLDVNELYRTDQGNLVLDCTAPAEVSLDVFAMQLQAIPGVMGHGFFESEIDALYLAEGERVRLLERPAPA
jgi:ribose 5-phosphate isomerase A